MKKSSLPEGFTVTAHSGAEGTPDNSIESILASIDAGADVFEVDVRFDKNGTPVITHNKSSASVPTIDEVFAVLAENKEMRCNLDLKETDNLPELLRLAKERGVVDQLFYTGVFMSFVEPVKRDTPEIPYYLNVRINRFFKYNAAYLLSVAKRVERVGAIGINLNYGGLSRELVRIFHSRGLLVSAWTVNDEKAMKKVLAMKPDNITTRKPVLLKKIIETK